MRVGEKPQGDEETYAFMLADGTPAVYADPTGGLLGDLSACTDAMEAHQQGAQDHFVNSVAMYHLHAGEGQVRQPQDPSKAAVADFTGLEPMAITAGMFGGKELATSVFDVHLNKARSAFQQAADAAQEAQYYEKGVRRDRRAAEKLLHQLEAGKGGKMPTSVRHNSIAAMRELVEDYPDQVLEASDKTAEARWNKAEKKEVVRKLTARRAWVKAGGVVGGGAAGALALKAAKIGGATLVKVVPGVGWALTAKDVHDHASEAAELTPREKAAMEIEKRRLQAEQLKRRLDPKRREHFSK